MAYLILNTYIKGIYLHDFQFVICCHAIILSNCQWRELKEKCGQQMHYSSLNSDCDFDNGLCYWTQVDDDDFDWELNKGQTLTDNTGPISDHTSGNGHYIYIESSEKDRHDIAQLVSPYQHAGKYCFSFWYNMYGQHVDRFRVVQWYTNGTIQELFRKAGNHGNKWIPENIIMESPIDFKIILEGRIKNAMSLYRNKGDIAVDDVLMMSCHDCDNPTPIHAVANSTNFEYGSVIEIICNIGYNLTGEAQMVCQAGGTWSSSRPVCKPYDCTHRNISNGDFIAPNGTTFGQTASQVCSKGYTLNGDTAVTCTSFGWNGTAGTCTIAGDCGNPTPTYANVNSTNFKYGSVVEISCNTGYNITGESVMVCMANGSWSSSSPTCELFDCGNRTLLNGQFSAPEGTTFGQTATHVCNIGFFLVGDTTVTCTDSGWKGIAGTCEIKDPEGSALIAVYVTVPLVVVVAIMLTIVVCRKMPLKCSKAPGAQHGESMNPVIQETMATNSVVNEYEHLNSNTMQTGAGVSALPSNEYAVLSDTVHTCMYYSNAEAKVIDKSDVKLGYKNVQSFALPSEDMSENTIGAKCEPNGDETPIQLYESLKTDTQNERDYDLLNKN